MEGSVVDRVVVIAGHVHCGDGDGGIIEEDIAFGFHYNAIGFRAGDGVGEGKHLKGVHFVIDGEGLKILVGKSGKIHNF